LRRAGGSRPDRPAPKIYAESFRDAEHLKEILSEGQTMVDEALAGASATGGPE
jgi:phosphoglucomutase